MDGQLSVHLDDRLGDWQAVAQYTVWPFVSAFYHPDIVTASDDVIEVQVQPVREFRWSGLQYAWSVGCVWSSQVTCAGAGGRAQGESSAGWLHGSWVAPQL
ncbi:MAG: hypothetical protein CL877_08575 [Dehalococcoidales bacterium]|nr:hypothetical protein [Dehalococcoidales bacterium]